MSRVRARYQSAGYEDIHMFPARESVSAQQPSPWIHPLLIGGSGNCGLEFLSVCQAWTHEPSNQLDNKLPEITSTSLAEAMLTSICNQISLLGEERFGSKNIFILFSLTKGVSRWWFCLGVCCCSCPYWEAGVIHRHWACRPAEKASFNPKFPCNTGNEMSSNSIWKLEIGLKAAPQHAVVPSIKCKMASLPLWAVLW